MTTEKRNDQTVSKAWNWYVRGHPRGTHGHLYGWKRVIEETYGHRAHYLSLKRPGSRGQLAGILPLIRMTHPLWGSRLVSLPFLDTGGILADSPEVERRLLEDALELAKRLNAGTLELRQATPLSRIMTSAPQSDCTLRTHKVSLAMPLPDAAETLRSVFKSKLRSQIRKAEKNGLHSETGRENLLDDFYAVFSRNMRDLGSPVHARAWFEKILEIFHNEAIILVVRQGPKPLAAAFTLRFRDTLVNPWASSLKESRPLASNMLLYWAMLKYACNNGMGSFDFGRSTEGAGTCRFKQQWGALASPLYWHSVSINGSQPPKETLSFNLWKRLPVPIATLLGPYVRKHISL